MKRLTLIALTAILLGSGCRKIEVDGAPSNNNNTGTAENVILEGRITANRTLKADYVYKLRGLVYVTNGAVLTIEPGTKIVGESGRNGGLVVTRSCKIIAEGTPDKPIVFTSESSSPKPGDWAGLVILGNAPTNASFNGVEGIGEIEGGINNSDGLGLYGTPITQAQNPADNSGILKYVRIEYAGFASLPDKEVNGLTLAGVGSQTVVDYVQVSYANDDSFEWFGGSVNCKHLISFKGLDDDFDTDNGYNGKVQFAIALRDSTVADISGSNGFESDNDAGGSSLAPQTAAVFSNVTLVGPRATLSNVGNSNFRRGAHTRRNSAISVFNSIIMGWPTGWLLDASTGTPTDLNLSGTSPKAAYANNIFAGNKTQSNYTVSVNAATGWVAADFRTYLENNGNSFLTENSAVELVAPFNYDNTVDFNPTATSPALSGASFSDSKLSNGFTPTSYRGACNANDAWWKGWTKF
jgi:hypothetical protein